MVSCSHYKLKWFLLCSLSILIVLLSSDLSIAKQVTFEREYTYQASEYDSKVTCRTLALEQAKKLLLEELGTYLETKTEVKNFQLEKDQIVMLTAGIVETEILDERWDGKSYSLRVKIKAEPQAVIQSIDALRKDRQKAKELEEIKKKADELLREVYELKNEIKEAKGGKQEEKQQAYREKIDGLRAIDWYHKGEILSKSGNYKGAIAAFSKAIELKPEYSWAYNDRGIAYHSLRNHLQAIKDYDKAIELEPRFPFSYAGRGEAYFNLDKYNRAIDDYGKAIELNSKDPNTYYSRGKLYVRLGNYEQAIKDFNKGIKLKPKYAYFYIDRGFAYGQLENYQQAIKDFDMALQLKPIIDIMLHIYSLRGSVYESLGNYKKAIKDYDKIIELEPKYPDAYYMRGCAYGKLGNAKQQINNMKIAARMGYEDAQDYLREQGIDW